MGKISRRTFITAITATGILLLTGQPGLAAGQPAGAVTRAEQVVPPPAIDVAFGQVLLGRPVEVTFFGRLPDLASFRYRLLPGQDWLNVAADTNGAATVTWTPTVAGQTVLDVVAVNTDGAESAASTLHLWVADPHPQVRTSYDLERPSGPAGFFEFRSELFDVSTFVYRVDDGPEQTVDADQGQVVTDYTATIGGEHLLTVHSVASTGERSPATEHTFVVTSAPRVTSATFPDGGTGGTPGVAGTFTFAPFLPDVVAYHYRFHSSTDGAGSDQDVQAAADGTATIEWTPPRADSYTLLVWAVTSSGAWSDRTDVLFTVPTAG